MPLSPREQSIADVYYHPRHGFGSIEHTHRLVSAVNPTVTRAEVRTFLKNQEIRQRKKPIGGNSYVPDYVRQQYQIDLADFGERAMPRYGFVAIDILSKKAACIPLLNKTPKGTAAALQTVFDELGYPVSVMVDEGGEFFADFAKLCENSNVQIIRSRTGARFAERFIRTLKLALSNRTLALGGRWSQYVQPVIDYYNESIHSATRMKPDTLHASDAEGYTLTEMAHARLQAKAKFPVLREAIQVGDRVKIRMKQPSAGYKETFNSWSSDVYTVARIEQNPAAGTEYVLTGYRRPLLRYEMLKIDDVQRPVNGQVRSMLQQRSYPRPEPPPVDPAAPVAAAVVPPSQRASATVFKSVTRAAAKAAATAAAAAPLPSPAAVHDAELSMQPPEVPHHISVARAAAEEAPPGRRTDAYFRGLRAAAPVSHAVLRPRPANPVLTIRRPATRSTTR